MYALHVFDKKIKYCKFNKYPAVVKIYFTYDQNKNNY